MQLVMAKEVKDVFIKLKIPIPDEAKVSFICVNEKDESHLVYLTESRLNKLMEQFSSYSLCSIREDFLRNGNVRNKVFEYGFQAKSGRVLNKICEGLNDKVVQNFTVHFQKRNKVFVIREDITKVYENEQPHSCMTGRNMEFFEENGVKILVLLNDENDKNSIVGRALLWEGVKKGKKEYTFMDRVYVTNHNFLQLFGEHADKNGWLKKVQLNQDGNCNKLLLGEQELTGVFEYQLVNPRVKPVPYFDTFKYFTPIEHTITNKAKQNSITDLKSYDFTTEPPKGHVWSEWENSFIKEEDAIHSTYYSDCIYRRDSVIVGGEIRHKDDMSLI